MKIEVDFKNKKVIIEDESVYPHYLVEELRKIINEYFPEYNIGGESCGMSPYMKK